MPMRGISLLNFIGRTAGNLSAIHLRCLINSFSIHRRRGNYLFSVALLRNRNQPASPMDSKPLTIGYSGSLAFYEGDATPSRQNGLRNWFWTYNHFVTDPSTRSASYL